MEKITYTVTEFMGDEIVTYEKDGFTYSIPKDPANADYQAYLKRDEAETK
jgi:hypothetical protein